MELTPGKFRAQLMKMDEAARQVWAGVFSRHLPPDRLLNDFFRANRGCGARDRRAISAAIYAGLRFWGFLRQLPGTDLRERIETGNVVLTARELLSLLAGALFIEGRQGELVENMRRELQLPKFPHRAFPVLRAESFARAVEVPKAFTPEQMIPETIFAQLAPGVDREKFTAALMRRPPVWLRVKDAKLPEVEAELDALKIAYRKFDAEIPALAVDYPSVNLLSLESFRRGDFEVQDLASMAIGFVAAPSGGQRWFDACAGAGGKTLMLAELMHGRGSITAGDIRERALAQLKLRARRARYSNISVRLHDGNSWKGRHAFDGVLIDAPCSGSGVWRRNPGLQWILDEAGIADCVARQKRILDAFASAVRPGGVLVYATCSLLAAENHRQVADFLAAHPGFALEDFPHPLTGEKCPGMVQIDGGIFDCDWMFVARMRRNC